MTSEQCDVTRPKTTFSHLILRVALWVSVGAQFLISGMLLLYYVSMWQDPKLDPDFLVEFNKHPEWAMPAIADLLLGALVMPVCGWGMLKRQTWAPIAYAIWLLLSIAFNEFRPHYILGMLEFPSVLPLVLICIYYLACANWERKQKP
jgi:hypothetical protein